ncbi:MAG: N-acetyl-gamma-glutamyl-phosphate reductase [bacterium]
MIKVSIIGATGYTGRELIRLLLRHRETEIIHLSAHIEKEMPISDIFPGLLCNISVKTTMDVASCAESDAIFLCLPHIVSQEYIPSLYELKKRVVDLSADFRLKDPDVYEEWYNTQHLAPHLIKESVYGLPELYREKIKDAKIIANPGCYPTSSILALAPAIKNRLIDLSSIIIDAKTGISGAGRSPSMLTHFPEANESVFAYSIFTHRHTPEINQELSLLAGERVNVTFTPHLIPMDCGILSTIYIKVLSDVKLLDVYKDFYKNEQFVRIVDKPPKTKEVVGTNLCLINIAQEKQGAVVTSAIDNLIKGASGQAVQNMNIMFGISEREGLL